MRAVLKIVSAKNKPVEREIEQHGMVVIGRSNKADVVLDDPKISGVHCRIHFKKDKLELTDLDSKNGTYINGIKLETSKVYIGDTIKFGQTTVTLNPLRMDRESVELLTFTGADRMNSELRADFTTVQNQKNLQEIGAQVPKRANPNKAKPAKPRAPATKQTVKAQHKTLASVAILIDVVLLIFFACLPVLVFDSQDKPKVGVTDIKSNKLLFILVLELVLVIGFFFLNFKVLKFSVGERLAGIRKLVER